jgi:hypothetical protein
MHKYCQAIVHSASLGIGKSDEIKKILWFQYLSHVAETVCGNFWYQKAKNVVKSGKYYLF